MEDLTTEDGITTLGAVRLWPGAEVSLKAPIHHLGPGFRVESGAILEVQATEVACERPGGAI